MAYSIDKKTGEIHIGGWERGIATSPHKGLGDIKALNVASMPGEVQVNYTRSQQSQTPTSGSITFNGSTTVTHSGLNVATGTAITISGSSDGTIVNGTYYVTRTGSTSFNLSNTYQHYIAATFLTAAGSTSASFTTINMTAPIAWSASYSTAYPNFDYFVADSGGYVWYSRPIGGTTKTTPWVILGAPSGSLGVTGLFCYGNYISICASGTTNALRYMTIGSFENAWSNYGSLNSDSSNNSPANNHFCLLSHNNTVYIADGQYVDSLLVNPGQTFNPASGATFTFTTKALTIAIDDTVTVMGELNLSSNIYILIGGTKNVVYNWDGLLTTVNTGTFLFLPENNTAQILTVNNLGYIFCGSKGNIYVTNGSSVTAIMTVPDYIADNTGTNEDPYFIWGGTMYLRGRVWFSVKAPNCGGIWSFVPTPNYFIEQDTGASLRLEHQNSYGTYSGYATLLFPEQGATGQQALGPQYFSGWDDGTSGGSPIPYGIDFSGTTAFTGGATIDSDLVPTGTLLEKRTFSQIEYKLAAQLVAGESIAAAYRQSLSDSFVDVGLAVTESSTALGGYFPVTFEKGEFLQLRMTLTAIASGSSWCRLTEIIVR